MDKKLRIDLGDKMTWGPTICVDISVGDQTLLFFTINLSETSDSAVAQ